MLTPDRTALLVGLLMAYPLTGAVRAWQPDDASLQRAASWKESVAADESTAFTTFATQINQIQRTLAGQTGGSPRRGFHAKAHAAMKAEFRVVPGLPDALRHGVFKESITRPCLVRFSNGVGGIKSDAQPDVRGLAVKVVGVPGQQLLDGDTDVATQDFLATNSPVSLARNATQFMAFAKANLNPLTLPFTLARELGARESARIAAFLATHVTRPIRSIATETYWSGGPIKLGPYAVKFMWKPVGAGSALGATLFRDGLRREFEKRLVSEDVAFDLFVQFFVDEARTPIEDSSVEWDAKVSPFLKVGELAISHRDLTTAVAQAEEEAISDLSFTPWHATEDHRPLGHTMRARKAVYRSSATLRRAAPEPTSVGTPAETGAAARRK